MCNSPGLPQMRLRPLTGSAEELILFLESGSRGLSARFRKCPDRC